MLEAIYANALTDYELQDLLIELSDEEINFAHDYLADLKLLKETNRSAQRPVAKRLVEARKGQYLNNQRVQDYMKHLVMAETERLQVTHTKVIDELAKIAFCDVREILQVDEATNTVIIRNLNEIPYPGVIKEFKSKQIRGAIGVVFEVKLYDKMQALQMLCSILGLQDVAQGANTSNTKKPKVINHITVNHRGRNQLLEITKP